MKKTFILVLAILFLASACTSAQVSENQDRVKPDAEVTERAVEAAEKESSAPKVGDNGYVCVFDSGLEIRLGVKFDEIQDKIGTITDTLEAPSCLYDGTDKVYTVDGAYTLTVTASADGERVTELSFISDVYALNMDGNYVMIGSDEGSLSFLGDPADDSFGVKKFSLAGGTLTAVITDGAVSGLTVSYAE